MQPQQYSLLTNDNTAASERSYQNVITYGVVLNIKANVPGHSNPIQYLHESTDINSDI